MTGMFGMSMIEIGVIMTLALVILGPEKIPPLARQLGRFMRQLRRASNELRETLEFEGLRDDVQRQLRDIQGLKNDLNIKKNLGLDGLDFDPYKDIAKEEENWRNQTSDDNPEDDEDDEGIWRPDESPQEPIIEDPHALPGVSLYTQSAAWTEVAPLDDENLIEVPLPPRVGWGSLDAELEEVLLPTVPASLLGSVKVFALFGGVRELRQAQATPRRPLTTLSEAVHTAPLRWRRLGSARKSTGTLTRVSIPATGPLGATVLTTSVSSTLDHQEQAQEEAS